MAERTKVLQSNLAVQGIETSKGKQEVTEAATLLTSGLDLFTSGKARNPLRFAYKELRGEHLERTLCFVGRDY